MATVPKTYIKEGRTWLKYFRSQDCHKWIIALEHGAGGLVHWQLRFSMRGLDTKDSRQNYFDNFKRLFPQAHMEFTENWCDYERKEGFFVSSDDSKAVLGVRFGVPTRTQKELLCLLKHQSDREITVVYDNKGNHGKSWLALHLWEKGRALLVPRYCTTARALSQFICSAYRGQPIIIIDIPRAGKPNRDLYETMEEIKDGAVFDERYTGSMRDIRGVKLLVFTNQKLDNRMLSYDRWRIYGISGEPLL